MKSGYSIPIVQGTVVSVPRSQQGNQSSYIRHDVEDQEGTDAHLVDTGRFQQQHVQQPNQYRDVIWAVAFVLHLGAMCFVISTNITQGENGQASTVGLTNLISLVAIGAIVSTILSSVSIALMARYPTEMVKAGLITSVALTGAMAILFILSGNLLPALFGAFFFAITLCYVKQVWRRIPFAAANLKTALSAVQSNLGLAVVAYLIMAVAFVWLGFWTAGILGSLDSSNGATVFLFLVSCYWTYEVLCNTIHVTTAGTVGTWWFVPGEANGCWSTAIRDSFRRASTYSFGSICFGSLLVAVVRALRAMAQRARDDDDMQLLYCLIQCILHLIEDIIDYFNRWAYVYVGLYGFGYIEAGRNVFQLFAQKGWSIVITDDLNDRVLLMMSLSVGVVTGIIGTLAAMIDQNLFGDIGSAFTTTFFVGLIFCQINMSVVASAVNTVIVCFAESPAEFEANHPGLSREMRSAWIQAWPELTI